MNQPREQETPVMASRSPLLERLFPRREAEAEQARRPKDPQKA